MSHGSSMDPSRRWDLVRKTPGTSLFLPGSSDAAAALHELTLLWQGQITQRVLARPISTSGGPEGVTFPASSSRSGLPGWDFPHEPSTESPYPVPSLTCSPRTPHVPGVSRQAGSLPGSPRDARDAPRPAVPPPGPAVPRVRSHLSPDSDWDCERTRDRASSPQRAKAPLRGRRDAFQGTTGESRSCTPRSGP